MDLGLKDKVALVAAPSRGLGRAVAEELAAEGASLLLCSRSEEAINKAAKEIAQTTGAKVLAVAADVSKADENRAVNATRRRTIWSHRHSGNKRRRPTGRAIRKSQSRAMGGRDALDTLQRPSNWPRQVLPGMKETTLGANSQHHFHRREAACR